MQNVEWLIPKRATPVLTSLEPIDVVGSPVREVPLLGFVQAGTPVDLVADAETITIPANMVSRETYALRVRGNSMIEENIQDGDIIVVDRRETAENGQTVVVMMGGETVTLKRFFIEADGIRLQPANAGMEPIFLRDEEIQILGIVKSVIRLPAT